MPDEIVSVPDELISDDELAACRNELVDLLDHIFSVVRRLRRERDALQEAYSQIESDFNAVKRERDELKRLQGEA